MLRNAAFNEALIALDLVVSGYRFVMTIPLMTGAIVSGGVDVVNI